jgi:hypothetical protein
MRFGFAAAGPASWGLLALPGAAHLLPPLLLYMLPLPILLLLCCRIELPST